MGKKKRVKKARKSKDIFQFTPIHNITSGIIVDNEIAYSLYLGLKKFYTAATDIIKYWETQNLIYASTPQNLSKKLKVIQKRYGDLSRAVNTETSKGNEDEISFIKFLKEPFVTSGLAPKPINPGPEQQYSSDSESDEEEAPQSIPSETESFESSESEGFYIFLLFTFGPFFRWKFLLHFINIY